MIAFEEVAARISAKDAAQHYGMTFGRNGRAVCPWHDDHRPDLAFYGRFCHCFACHAGGDAVALTAQLFGMTMPEAARKLNVDFKLNLDMNPPDNPALVSETLRHQREKQQRHKEYNRQWSFLCDVVREADQRISQFPADDATWDNNTFLNALKARAIADEGLEIMKYLGEDASS